MATVLTTENITQARAAVTNYRTTCQTIFANLKNDITNLTASNFKGDASMGYVEFFEQITPALTTNLTDSDNSITAMLENLISLVEQMLTPVDPDIGNANKTAVGEGGTNNG